MFKYVLLASLPIIFTSCFKSGTSNEKHLPGVYVRVDADEHGTIWDTLTIHRTNGIHLYTIERGLALQAIPDNRIKLPVQHRHEHWVGTYVTQEDALLVQQDEQVYYLSSNLDTLDNGIIKYKRLHQKH